MDPAAFLRAEHDEIIARWGARAGVLPRAHQLPGLVLLDHLPHLLEAMARRIEGSASQLALEATALEHAIDRFRHDVPLHEVVTEFTMLREAVEGLYREKCGFDISPAFGLALDEAVQETRALYERASEKPPGRPGDGVGAPKNH
ncbi:MAG TPA: hypothetical protein VGI39_13715 [Polyangiaceae bacterium]|jgi:hypothetical protein